VSIGDLSHPCVHGHEPMMAATLRLDVAQHRVRALSGCGAVMKSE
jgi:hypothetical protein